MDKEIAGADVAVGAVGSEGEQRSSTLSPARMTRASRRWRLVSDGALRASAMSCCS
jgi:hypothetical protein